MEIKLYESRICGKCPRNLVRPFVSNIIIGQTKGQQSGVRAERCQDTVGNDVQSVAGKIQLTQICKAGNIEQRDRRIPHVAQVQGLKRE